MRTLKKTLCLVLALAMMVGLCAVGASAVTVNDYKDKDQIPNMEAFATLTAIGVFQGDDTGNVNPTASLTRAEGATVITKMHATSGAGTSSFTDMATAAWAQGAVAYCEANGIIAGYGDGTFGPSDPLSTVAFAKMCLTSLGYDAAIEGLTGSQWEINTIKLVNSLDLAAGIATPDWNGACPRWVAAQLAFNTLTKTMQEYKGGMNVNVKTGDGTDVHVTEDATPVPVDNNSYDYTNVIDGDMQFCEQYFPNLKRTNTADDAWGMPTNTWYMGDNRKDATLTPAKKIVAENAGTILKTYDTFVYPNEKTIYADANGTGASVALDVYENGTLKETVNIYRTGDDAAKMPFAGYAGATITLVDAHKEGEKGFGTANRAIVKYPYLATVTKVNAATATADRSVNLKIYNQASGATATCSYTTSKFEKGDWVLVYPAGTVATTKAASTFTSTAILNAVPAETVKGTLSKITTANSKTTALTIDGVAYTVGANANLGPKSGETVSTTNYQLGVGMTAYTANGFVLGVVPDAVSYGNYVFVLGAQDPSSTLGTNTHLVGILNQDGTTEEIKATTSADGFKKQWATKTESTGGLFTVKKAVAKNGTDELTKPVAISAINPTNPNVGGYIADANTKFIFRTLKDGVYTYKTYAGLANVPTYDSMTATAYMLLPDYTGAHIAAAFIDVTAGDPKNTTTSTIYLLSGTNGGQQMVDGKSYYIYTGIVDGAKQTILATSDHESFTKYGVVIPAYSGAYLDGTDDNTTLTNAAKNHVEINTTAAYAITVDAGLITFYEGADGTTATSLALSADCVAYLYTAKNVGNELESGAPKDIVDGQFGGVLSLVKAKDGSIKTIYLVK